MNMEEQKRHLLEHLRRDISDERVLQAMERVPREAFIPEASRHLAYEDIPLPIGEGQTISQPLIVALMIARLNLKPTDKVLELGAGSGYQAAILSLLVREVITTERLPSLANAAQALLTSLGYHNVSVRLAGEVLGCPEEAPFDAIIVAAGAPRLPMVLLDQLVEGGRMVIPVGSRYEQDLSLVKKTREGYSVKSLGPCRFVPLIGAGAWEEESDGHGSEAGIV
ncbi:protein-L-isoaspartate(D-aspartate) O-methyltransferase [Chloroflexota bacterium]